MLYRMQSHRLLMIRQPPVVAHICQTCSGLRRTTILKPNMRSTLHASTTLNGNLQQAQRVDCTYLLVANFVVAEHYDFLNMVFHFPTLILQNESGHLAAGSSSRPWLKPGGKTMRKKKGLC